MKQQGFFNRRNIPNGLSILRIGLAVLVVFLLLLDTGWTPYQLQVDGVVFKTTITWLVAMGLFLVAAVTDLLDGYLARRYHWQSELGKIIDPIADKLLVNSVLIVFASTQIFLSYLVIIMIMRDLIMDVIRIKMAFVKIDVQANTFGKLKTLLVMWAILFSGFLFHNGITSFSRDFLWFYYVVQNGFMFLATLCSLGSFGFYLYNFYRQKRALHN